MVRETVFSNAGIVTPDAVIHGSVVVRDGVIAEIGEGPSRVGHDLGGEFLVPGLVELHTDHLESHIQPRPKVRWNPHAAVQAHDAQLATAGVTTVLDAIRLGSDENQFLTGRDMREVADVIEQAGARGRLRADHFIHLRCEVSAPNCFEDYGYFAEDPRVRLASLMDHAPGQRQFVSLEAYSIYYQPKLNLNDPDFRRFVEDRIEQSRVNAPANRRAIAEACRARGVMLASHDDATEEHVAESVAFDVRIAEFPTTRMAARASSQAGLSVLMGAPNVIRGGSHSGNVSARDLAADGLLDILSSDYIPFSLIQSAFFLADVEPAISLPRAVGMVSKRPAEAVGLFDRGAIEVGRRADLVRVLRDEAVPVVREVWREGARVA